MPFSSAWARIHLSDMMLKSALPLYHPHKGVFGHAPDAAPFRRNDHASQAPAASLDVEHADEREQAAGGVEIQFDLAVQAFLEGLRRFVVDRAPRYVDR